jgi:hypothetical protein
MFFLSGGPVTMSTLRTTQVSDVPGFLVWQIQNAEEGGAGGYSYVGYTLAGSLLSVVPDGCSREDWEQELTALGELVLPTSPQSNNDDAILRWFDDHFPACMERVPSLQRAEFLAGIHQAVEVGIIELG